MNKIYRIIDANINRVSEGLRVLEDHARFLYLEQQITIRIKNLRHTTRKTVNCLYNDFLSGRDSLSDIGLGLSQQSSLDNKESTKELIIANFKRVQEGLRAVEENLKLVGQYEMSKIYERLRYESYSIEKAYYNIQNINSERKLPNADLYCITAHEHSRGRSNIEVVQSLIKSGIKIIQYREKDKKKLQKYIECLRIRELTKSAGVTFIVNDDIDIAILVKADGVHIGQDDLPIERVRELVGEEMIIGVSTHSPVQAQAAVRGGADYIGVGPIFKTYTKKDVCDPVGLDYLDYVVRNIDIPFVAIGGIKAGNLRSVIERGAKCIAMVTEIVGAKEIDDKIKELRGHIPHI